MSPKDFEIDPIGLKGFGFEEKGYQERNMENLVNILSNKEATETLTQIAKVKKEEWNAMSTTITGMTELVQMGGLEGVFGRFEENLSLQVENALSPLTNEVNQLVAEALKPILPMISATLNEATDWITISVGSWEAVFTGKWDEVFEDISAKMPDWMKDFKNMVNQWWYDTLNAWKDALRDQIALGTEIGTNITTWGNEVNQWWYDLWISLGWR